MEAHGSSARTLEQVQPCHFSQLSHSGSKLQTSPSSGTPAHLGASSLTRNLFLLSPHPQLSSPGDVSSLAIQIKTWIEDYHPALTSPAETKASGGLIQGVIREVIATGQQRVLFFEGINPKSLSLITSGAGDPVE